MNKKQQHEPKRFIRIPLKRMERNSSQSTDLVVPYHELMNKRPVGRPPSSRRKKKMNGILLTAKQRRFVDEYMKDLNGTQAAIRAGYSKATAPGAGTILLNKKNVAEAIKQKQSELQKKYGLEYDAIIKRYLMLADYKITDLLNSDCSMRPLDEISEEAVYAICGFDHTRQITNAGKDIQVENRISKFKMADKISALNALTRLLGYTSKDNEQPGGGTTFNFNQPVQINVELAE